MISEADDGRMIAPDLITDGPDGPRLIAWRRRVDGRIVFPQPDPGDPDQQCDPLPLHPVGRLWSWTVQRFRPKSPPYIGPDGDSFRPYAVGYVEFPEGIIVEGRIDADFEQGELCIGTPMVTTVMTLFEDTDGRPVQIYAFRPGVGAPAAERG